MAVADLTRALSIAEAAGSRPDYRLFRDYFDGRHKLKLATEKFQQDYGQLVLGLRENLCPAVVFGFIDDLEIQTWGDKAAVDTATAQGLSRLIGQWTQEVWTSGDGYVMVWPNSRNIPVPHLQDADTGIPEVDPDDPSQLRQYTKRWIDPLSGHGRVLLVYPDHVERYATRERLKDPKDPAAKPSPFPASAQAWAPFSGDGDPAYIPHSFGSVPVCWIPLDAGKPGAYGRSILTDVVPLQDALNKSVADMVVLGEDYAEPFWYLLKYRSNDNPHRADNPFVPSLAPAPLPGVPQGAGLVGDATAGQPARKFDRRRQSVFTTSAEGPMGQLDPPDLKKLNDVQDSFALKITRVVGLPSFYVTQTSGDVPSGESLRVLLTRRTGRLRRFQNEALPVIRGFAQLMGIENADPRWAPITQVDEVEKWTIAQQQDALGMDLEDVLEYADIPDAKGIAQRAAERKAARTKATDAQVGAYLTGNAAFGV